MAGAERVPALLRCVSRVRTTAPASRQHGRGQVHSSVPGLVVSGLLGPGVAGLGALVAAAAAVRDVAGPAAVVAVVVGAAAAVMSGCCLAELRSAAARVSPGSAYDYMYVSGGEGLAFLTAWTLLLQHVTGASLAARAISQNVDAMTGYSIANATVTALGRLDALDSHADFLGFAYVVVVMVMAAVGVPSPSRPVAMVTSAVAAAAVTFLLALAAPKCDFRLWGAASGGGFAPRGAEGVFLATAALFFLFTSHEYIMSSSDFTLTSSRKPVLRAAAISMIVSAAVLLAVSGAVSLLPSGLPGTEAPLVEAFAGASAAWTVYLITPAVIIALSPELMSRFQASVGLSWDLATDGLFHSTFRHVVSPLSAPLAAVLLLGLLSALLALLLPTTTLLMLTSACSLLTSTAGCAVVLAMQYQPVEQPAQPHSRNRTQNNNKQQRQKYGAAAQHTTADGNQTDPATYSADLHYQNSGSADLCYSADSLDQPLLADEEDSSDTDIDDVVHEYRIRSILSCHMGMGAYRAWPTESTYVQAKAAVTLYVIWAVCVAVTITQGSAGLSTGRPLPVCLLVGFLLLTAAAGLHLLRQPRDQVMHQYYLVAAPACPWLPLAAIAVNTHLLALLPTVVWATLLTWTAIGVVVYAVYGARHSAAAAAVSELLPAERRRLIRPQTTPGGGAPRGVTAVQSDPIIRGSHGYRQAAPDDPFCARVQGAGCLDDDPAIIVARE